MIHPPQRALTLHENTFSHILANPTFVNVLTSLPVDSKKLNIASICIYLSLCGHFLFLIYKLRVYFSTGGSFSRTSDSALNVRNAVTGTQ